MLYSPPAFRYHFTKWSKDVIETQKKKNTEQFAYIRKPLLPPSLHQPATHYDFHKLNCFYGELSCSAYIFKSAEYYLFVCIFFFFSAFVHIFTFYTAQYGIFGKLNLLSFIEGEYGSQIYAFFE